MLTHVNRDLYDNNTVISLDTRINCTGSECITACKTLHTTIFPLNSTINPHTTLGSTIISTEPCLVIVKNVNHKPHCEGRPEGSISVSLTKALCRKAVPCPVGSQSGCSCCTKRYFKKRKCPVECSSSHYCATGSASYGKFCLTLIWGYQQIL